LFDGSVLRSSQTGHSYWSIRNRATLSGCYADAVEGAQG